MWVDSVLPKILIIYIVIIKVETNQAEATDQRLLFIRSAGAMVARQTSTQ